MPAAGVGQIARLGNKLQRLRKGAGISTRLSEGSGQALMSSTAAIAAYVPTQWLGLHEGFWGAITALAVTQIEYGAVRSTARDQMVGAGIGGMIGLVALLLVPHHGLARYGIAVAAAVLFCWLANVASAARLSAITATIILLVPHTGAAERMYVSRVFEVAWGVTVAMIVAWSGSRLVSWLTPSLQNSEVILKGEDLLGPNMSQNDDGDAKSPGT